MEYGTSPSMNCSYQISVLEYFHKCMSYSCSCSWKNLHHFKDLTVSVQAKSHSEVKWRPLDNIETHPSPADISHPSALIVLLSPAAQIYDTQLPRLQLPPHNRSYYLTIVAINSLVLLFISRQPPAPPPPLMRHLLTAGFLLMVGNCNL